MNIELPWQTPEGDEVFCPSDLSARRNLGVCTQGTALAAAF